MTAPRLASLRTAGRLDVVVLLTAVLALAGACGRPATTEIQASPLPSAAAPAAGAPDSTPLPTLPSIADRAPGRFDDQGCLRTGASASDCAQQAPALDAAAAGHAEQDWRTLAGFEGRFWTDDLARQATVVLEPSITSGAAADGRWTARGLARNEGTEAVAGIEVVATLVGPDGGTIETVRATSPVGPVRPGEPVPFVVVAATSPASSVAAVRWTAEAIPGEVPSGTRDLELTTYWTRGYGEPRPVELYFHRDPVGAPTPYLLFGSLTDHGPTVTAPHVVAAFVDRAGRVLAVVDATPVEADGTPAASLVGGDARDVLVVVDDPTVGPALADAAPMLWGAGR